MHVLSWVFPMEVVTVLSRVLVCPGALGAYFVSDSASISVNQLVSHHPTLPFSGDISFFLCM